MAKELIGNNQIGNCTSNYKKTNKEMQGKNGY